MTTTRRGNGTDRLGGGGGRVARLTVGAAVLLALSAAPAAGQNPGVPQQGTWQDTTYIDAVIRLDVENGPSAVIPALTYGSTLLLPLRQFLQMVEIRVAAFALRDSAVAMLEPGHVPVRFQPRARVLTRGVDSVPYDTLDIVWWDGDLFVATGVLDRLLGVSTSVDWPSLAAMVGRTTGLPVVLRARRERRRQLLGVERPAPDVLDLALRQRAVDGAVLSWSLTAASRGPTNQFALDLGFGAGLFGGSAELRPVFWSTYGASGSELRWSWSRASGSGGGRGGIRQLRIGDVHSNGRRARLLQGVAVTNAPFIRSSEFDVEQFVTEVPAGWEAELYESGRLLAFADADAVGAFRVPLQLGYGQNPFEVVLYGPGGETVRQARTIRVPFSRLPSRHLEYAVAGGRCRYEACDGLLSADARYGLSNRLTLQAGWDALFYGPEGTLWQPYAVVSGAPLPSLGLTGEAVVNGHVRASANYEPSLDFRVTAGHTRFSSAGARFGEAFSESARSEATLFWRPGWMRGAAYVQSTGVVATGPTTQRRLARVAATTRFGRVRYSLGVLRDVIGRTGATTTRRFAVDAGADAILEGPWRWLRAASLQTQLAVEPSHGITAARAVVGRRVSHALRLDAGVGWLRGAGVNVEVAFNTATPGPRLGARSRVSEAGTQGLLTSSGSLAFDPRTRLVRLSDATDLGRAGISGVLFRDDNGNGTRDPGEPGLPGIPVRVGGWPAETDADGRFAAWGMYPSEPLRIDVDTLSLGNPQFVLPAPVLRVRPAPNAFGAIAVPVVVGAEISGFVVLGEQPLAGVPVVLRELNTGAEITTLTFSDGGFYRGAVPPGEYEVTLPDGVQERLQVAVPPLHIFVPPGAGEKRYQDLHLRLEPRS